MSSGLMQTAVASPSEARATASNRDMLRGRLISLLYAASGFCLEFFFLATVLLGFLERIEAVHGHLRLGLVYLRAGAFGPGELFGNIRNVQIIAALDGGNHQRDALLDDPHGVAQPYAEHLIGLRRRLQNFLGLGLQLQGLPDGFLRLAGAGQLDHLEELGPQAVLGEELCRFLWDHGVVEVVSLHRREYLLDHVEPPLVDAHAAP